MQTQVIVTLIFIKSCNTFENNLWVIFSHFTRIPKYAWWFLRNHSQSQIKGVSYSQIISKATFFKILSNFLQEENSISCALWAHFVTFDMITDEASKSLLCKCPYPQAAPTTLQAIFWQCPTATVTSTTPRDVIYKYPKTIKLFMYQSISGFLRVKHQQCGKIFSPCFSKTLYLCFNVSQITMINLPSLHVLWKSKGLTPSPPNPECQQKACVLFSFTKQKSHNGPATQFQKNPAWKIV